MINDDFKEIIIFAGTTEGRFISMTLASQKMKHTVCVATEYGHLMMSETHYAQIHEGRMDDNEMSLFFDKKTRIVIDATHPYAVDVTANIKRATDDCGVKYIRVLRDDVSHGQSVEYFDSIEECAFACDAMCGAGDSDGNINSVDDFNGYDETSVNIMLTTGSKDLHIFASKMRNMSNVYARVLPSEESIRLCLEAGIRSDHIIAMHGPFSMELNLSLIRQYNISCLVTKASGRAGGVIEKEAAAAEANIKCMVIGRPVAEKGMTVLQALNEVGCKYTADVNVDIIGIGMGYAGLTVEGQNAIKKADIVFGAPRLLEVQKQADIIREVNCYPYYMAEDILPVIENKISEKIGSINVAVLYSGDTGFFSGASRFQSRIRDWGNDNNEKINLNVNILPGISSISYLSSKIGLPYSDAKIVSLHGKNDLVNITINAKEVSTSKTTYILLSDIDDLIRLNAELRKIIDSDCEGSSLNYVNYYIGKKLSYPDEEIKYISSTELDNLNGASDWSLVTACIINEKPVKRV